MEWFQTLSDKWVALREKMSPVLKKAGEICSHIGSVLKTLGGYLYKLRGAFIAIPVAVVAVIQAMLNMERLPDTVEYTMLRIDPDAAQTLFGPFAMSVVQMSRETAVMGPLLLTAACLVFTLLSKRTLFPWLISVFTLLIPTVLYLLTCYPA